MPSSIDYATDRVQLGRGRALRPLLDRRDARAGIGPALESLSQAFGVACVSALQAGCGLLLAVTSDGGALSATIYDGDDRLRSYAGSTEEVEELLQAITDHALASSLGPQPTGPRKSPRKP